MKIMLISIPVLYFGVIAVLLNGRGGAGFDWPG
jgi:hypothetical protein